MTVRPLVSTIIPVRNRPRLIVEAVNSVLAQTHRPIEIIIVDDGSTDATADVCRALAHDHAGITVVQQPHAGVAAARNAAIARARGDYIQFLDSDDLISPHKFERQVAALEANPGCGISYCRTREYRLGGAWCGRAARRTGQPLPSLFPHLLKGRVWPAPSPLYRRDVIDANGPMILFSKYEDWEYEARAAARHVRLHHCDEYLADKRDAHEVEGGRKGATAPHQWSEYAEVHRRVFGYAREAGVAAGDLDRFASKLLHASRRCAAEGFAVEAESLIGVAQQAARGSWRRFALTCYAAVCRRAGWQRVARAVEWFDAAAPLRLARQARAAAGIVPRWGHRVREARATVTGRPFSTWPHLLAERWATRQSRPRTP